MRSRGLWIGALTLVAASTPSGAADWELSVDLRAVTSDAGKSVLDGGFSPVRYGQDESGAHLTELRLGLAQALGELWTVHLNVLGPDLDIRGRDKTPLGPTEAYVQFRPYPFYAWPSSGYRLRLKAGAFYAPVSLENRTSGWESPYTLSYSAIDSWIARELRTIGVEGQLDWLGSRTGHTIDLGLTGGVFGWNDSAGSELANGGFTLQDRQATLFSRFPGPGTRAGPTPDTTAAEYSASWLQPFHEVDHRAGVYGGLEARYLDRAVVRVLHYDNRADPTAANPLAGLQAWHTRFDSAGLRVESASGWTAIAQWIDGQTRTFDEESLEWPFSAYFGLVSKRIGRQWLTARYDRFEVRSANEEADGAQTGHAWTVTYGCQPNTHWHFTLEWLRVTSNSYNRGDYPGLPALATETQIQLGARYAVGFRSAPR